MPSRFDVYAYGVIASNTLYLLEQPFPAPNGYAELGQTFPMTGGEALNSAIVMRRLGLRVRLDGNWLGDSDDGRRPLETIRASTSTPSGSSSRKTTSGRRWNVPEASDIAAARMVCVDPPFGDESLLAGRLAAEHGVPFVSIDCPYDSPLATDGAAVIVSREFRRQERPDADPDALSGEYRSRAAGLVVLTRGDEPLWFGRRCGEPGSLDPFRVDPIDTAGTGDSFRAGLIYGLLQGWDDRSVVR